MTDMPREHLAAERDALARLQRIWVMYVRNRSLSEVLTEVVETAIAITGADFGNIRLLEPISGNPIIVAQRGFPEWWREFWQTASNGEEVPCTALSRGERVIVQDVECSPIFVGTAGLDIQRRAGVRALQATPLVDRTGKLLGMLSTHYKRPHRPDEQSLRLLDMLADQVGDIIERACAEDALRKNEERLRALVIASSNVVYRMSPDWKEMHHLVGQAFIADTLEPSRTWLDKYIHADDRALVLATINEAIRTQGIFDLEHRVLRPDGSLGWAHSRAIPIMDARGQITEWFGMASDITGKRMALHASLMEKERFRQVFEHAATGIAITDLEGRFEQCNPAYSALLGYTEEEFRHLKFSELVHPEDREANQAAVRRVLAGETTQLEIENRYVRKDGSLVWVRKFGCLLPDDSGQPVHMMALVTDMSERIIMEERLRSGAERLDLALSTSNLGTWDSNRATGKVIYDERFCAMLGYKPEDLAPDISGWLDLVCADDKQAILAAIEAHERGDIPNLQYEYRCRHKEGHWVWISALGKIVSRDAAGNPQRLVGTTRDITAQKRMDKEGTDLLKRIEMMMRDVVAGQSSSGQVRATDGKAIDGLPRRQRQILIMIAQGMTSAAIAERLQIAKATVVTHRRELMHRLDLHSTAELTRFAIEHHLLNS